MKKMTEEFLKAAFSGESQAHMKYLIFAEKAEEEGLKNVARLFRAIAYAEYVHAKNHLEELGLVSVTKDNLRVAIDGENYEVQEMYPVYNNTAKMQGEKGAERSTRYALEAEKIHVALYSKTMQIIMEEKDIELENVYICPRCGYTVEGEPPDRCPVCGLPKERFKEF